MSPGEALRPTEEADHLARELSVPRWLERYPAPRYEGGSLPNLAVSAYLRAGGSPDKNLAAPLDRRYVRGVEGEGPTVVFLLDGFGWNVSEAFLERARSATERRLATHLRERALPFTTVFPSTTSSALLSLSHGVAPATHGIVGYTEYFPAWGSILNTLKFAPPWGGPRDVAIGRQFQPSDLLPLPSLFKRGVRSTALTKDEFQGSAFTRMLYDGAKFEGYLSLSDLSHHLARILSAPRASRPGLVWVYWDLMDAVGHLNGARPELFVAELSHVLMALASAAAQTPPASREGVHLFLTGDHGQVNVQPEHAFAAHEDPVLMGLLQRPPSGERRASFLQAREGKRAELEAHLRRTLPPGWGLLTVEEVVQGGLLGPPPHHPELRDRLGDLLVLPPEGSTMWYRPPGSRGPEDRFLKGSHGALTPSELLVSLVSVPFDELARWDG